jgi:DMSO reductase anchor subunit
LGQPRKAWRAFLGLRTSWLSREIVALGAYAGALALAVGSDLASGLFASSAFASVVSGSTLSVIGAQAGAVAPVVGLIAVGCSAMVYIDTPRPCWATWRTWLKFASTTLLGACLAVLVVGVAAGASRVLLCGAAAAASAILIGKLYV